MRGGDETASVHTTPHPHLCYAYPILRLGVLP